MKTRLSALTLLLASTAALAALSTGCPKKPPAETPTPTPEESPSPTPTPNLEDQMKGQAPPSTPVEEEESCFKTIHFALDKATIEGENLEYAKAAANCLAAHKDWTVLIEGHCDERGSTQYNLALGERRAHTVREYLLTAGIDKKRVKTISYGNERPVDPGHNEEAWAKNRRAEFRVTK